MTPFSTPLSRRLGLRYPIVCAPMFIISNERMLVACAEAGILGAMPSLNARTPAELEEKLRYVRDRTDRPFAINMTIGLTAPERLQADVALCEQYEVPVWITSYGDPTAIAARAHARGATVFHDVIHLKHALKAQAAGVDAIIGVGAGAGGHAGLISPFALIPYLREHLSVPVIAAGCISTGRQIAASLVLGAELVYMGTRFIVADECGAAPAYKRMVCEAGPEDVVYTAEVSGIHANFLKASLPGARPAGEAAEKPAEKSAEKPAEAAKKWKDIWSAGQGVAEIHDTGTIEEIVQGLVRQYHDAVEGLRAR